MKDKFIHAHMEVAYIYAQLSHCVRLKVGCVIVKNNTPIAIGYNGTPAGEDNVCEITTETGLVTKPHVIHAEDNALRKLTSCTESAAGSYMFLTHAPCELCAERIRDAGVVRVYYGSDYQSTKGLDKLRHYNIDVEKVHIKENK